VISNQNWVISDIKESLMKEVFCLRNVLAVSWRQCSDYRWGQHIPPKCQHTSFRLHCITSQNSMIFIIW